MTHKISNPLLVGLFAMLPLAGCDKDKTDATKTDNAVAQADQAEEAREEAQEKAEERSADKIEAVKEGEVAAGSPMNVTGEVDSKLSAKAFKLEAVNELWGDEVLVLSKQDINIEEGSKVKVDGTVQKLVVADMERELGWDLEPKLEVEYSAKNVIVADSVTSVPDSE